MSYRTHTSEHTCLFDRVATAHLNSAECVHTCVSENFQKYFADTCVHGCVYTCVHTPPKHGSGMPDPPKMAKMAKYTKPGLQLQTGFSCICHFGHFGQNPELGCGARTCARPARQKKMLATSCARARVRTTRREKKKKIFFFFLFFLMCTRARACAHCRKKKNFFFFRKFPKNVKKTGFLPP